MLIAGAFVASVAGGFEVVAAMMAMELYCYSCGCFDRFEVAGNGLQEVAARLALVVVMVAGVVGVVVQNCGIPVGQMTGFALPAV